MRRLFRSVLCVAVALMTVFSFGCQQQAEENYVVVDVEAPVYTPEPTPVFEETPEPAENADLAVSTGPVADPAGTPSPYTAEDKLVAITIDDGPYKKVTPVILDVVEQYADQNVHLTFFVLGNQAEKYPEIVKRAVDLGCEIGNHTYSHINLTKVSEEERLSEINLTNDIVKQASGFDIKLVRPPYGAKDDDVKATVPYPLILWNVDTIDWQTRDTQNTFEVATNVNDGDIILMHDVHDDTAEAIKLIVPELLSQGFKLVTVSELYAARGAELVPGKHYRHCSP